MVNSFLCNPPSFYHNTVRKPVQQQKKFSTASPKARTEFGIKPPRDSICKQTHHCAIVVAVWFLWVLPLKSTTTFVQTTGRRRNIIKNSWKIPCLGGNSILLWVRPPAATLWLSSPRPNGAAHPSMALGTPTWHRSCQAPPSAGPWARGGWLLAQSSPWVYFLKTSLPHPCF